MLRTFGKGITKPPAGAAINWSHPLANGLLAAYLANEGGGSVVRSAVDGHPLTFSGTAPYWNADGIRFDGSSNSAMTGADGPNISNSPFTIVLSTANVGVLAANSSHISIGTAFATRQIVGLRVQSASSINFFLFSDDLVVTGLPTLTGAPLHIVGTLAANRLQTLYLNGVRVGSRTAGGLATPTRTVYVSDAAFDANFIAQDFKHALVYNRALSDSEVAWLYAEPYAYATPKSAVRYYTPDIGPPSPAASPADWYVPLSLPAPPKIEIVSY